VKVGAEDKKKLMWAGGLGAVAVLVLVYQFIPSGSTSASAPLNTPAPVAATPSRPGPSSHRVTSGAAKKVYGPASLDPTLHLEKLAATEGIKYEGSGRNIFVSQAEDIQIPKVIGKANTDGDKPGGYTTPTQLPPPPIPLKFFGFASRTGEPKKIFLSQNEDVWVAGEGDIVNRRYKVVRISNNSVEIQDMVVSGPPQSIPLTTQG
jgi:hypothetical protein